MTQPGRPAGPVRIDALGLLCPLPILRARQALARMAPGDEALLLSDDEEILRDLPAWCEAQGHELLSLERLARDDGRDEFRGLVRKGSSAGSVAPKGR